jgi:hypothetical protein
MMLLYSYRGTGGELRENVLENVPDRNMLPFAGGDSAGVAVVVVVDVLVVVVVVGGGGAAAAAAAAIESAGGGVGVVGTNTCVGL